MGHFKLQPEDVDGTPSAKLVDDFLAFFGDEGVEIGAITLEGMEFVALGGETRLALGEFSLGERTNLSGVLEDAHAALLRGHLLDAVLFGELSHHFFRVTALFFNGGGFAFASAANGVFVFGALDLSASSRFFRLLRLLDSARLLVLFETQTRDEFVVLFLFLRRARLRRADAVSRAFSHFGLVPLRPLLCRLSRAQLRLVF